MEWPVTGDWCELSKWWNNGQKGKSEAAGRKTYSKHESHIKTPETEPETPWTEANAQPPEPGRAIREFYALISRN